MSLVLIFNILIAKTILPCGRDLREGKLQSGYGEEDLTSSYEDMHGDLQEKNVRVWGMKLNHTARELGEGKRDEKEFFFLIFPLLSVS